MHHTTTAQAGDWRRFQLPGDIPEGYERELVPDAYQQLAANLAAALDDHTDDRGVIFPMQTYLITATAPGREQR